MPDASADGVDRILALLEAPGNEAVLAEWIETRDTYELVEVPADVATASFDCCILDVQNLQAHRDELEARKDQPELFLPYLLLVGEDEAVQVRETLRAEHPALWERVDAVIEMPIERFRLSDQLESLLRIRHQSIEFLGQQEQLRAIRDEHAGHGVVITDTEGTIEYVNRAFETKSGYTSEEAIGKNPRILQSGKHEKAFYQELWETICSGSVWHGVVENQTKDGRRYVLNQTIAPAVGPDGEIERFIAVNHEITDLKEMEERLLSQREELEILNRVLRHDIRNDMNVIIGWATALECEVSADGRENLDRIIQAGDHVVELTQVTRDLVETIVGDEDPEIEPIHLGPLLQEELGKRRATFERATIEIPDPPGDSTTVAGNPLLSSVFRNLINNAVQHNDSETPRVRISVEEKPDTVVVRVSDNGPGVPDATKEEVFGEGKHRLESQGTGMGLYLVSILVGSYGGEVWVEDNEPTGAVFAVSLPRLTDGSRTAEGIG